MRFLQALLATLLTALAAQPPTAEEIRDRRVVMVDGKPVDAPGTSLADMLQTLDPGVVARRLLDQSARHNLGQPRATNMPSLPLELLQPGSCRRDSPAVNRPRQRGRGRL